MLLSPLTFRTPTPLLRGLQGRLAALVTVGLLALPALAAPQPFRDLQVDVRGSGRPVLMLPGLNSAAAVWTDTCAALQPGVQCHLVQLPGFAGARAARTDAYLEPLREQLLAYVQERRLDKPVLVGHSLGGALSLMLAAQAPGQFDRVVVVDALPFLAELRNPAATPELARAGAQAMREPMLKSTPEQVKAQVQAMAPSMTRVADRQPLLVQWGQASDLPTTTAAMVELWGDDLRPLLPRISRPVLVLGSWAAYQSMGATQASTRAIFERQYAGLKGVRIEMSAQGYHFLMWDDPDWLVQQIKAFLQQP